MVVVLKLIRNHVLVAIKSFAAWSFALAQATLDVHKLGISITRKTVLLIKAKTAWVLLKDVARGFGRLLQILASKIVPALVAAFKPLLLAAAKIIAVFTAISVAINLFTDFDNTIINLKRFGKELLSIFDVLG